MRILYIKNNENVVETKSYLEEAKKRYNSLAGDASVSNLSLITIIKEYFNTPTSPDMLYEEDEDIHEEFVIEPNEEPEIDEEEEIEEED